MPFEPFPLPTMSPIWLVLVLSIQTATCLKCLQDGDISIRDYLFCRYDKSEIPRENGNGTVEVKVGFAPLTTKYETYQGKLSIFGRQVLIWRDKRLDWEDTDYPKKDLHVSTSSIWIPDISLYNKFDYSGSPVETTQTSCSLTSHGGLICIFYVRYESVCLPDATKYPFDTQNCSMTMGSWVHTGEALNLTLHYRPVYMDEYKPENKWTLTTVVANKEEEVYCCPNYTVPSLHYEFVLRRNSGGHVSLVIVPAVAMVIMSLLTLCLNSTEIERVYLICLNLLVHNFYIHYISWQVPISGIATPLLLIYARDSLLLVCFGLILTVLERRLIRTKTSCPGRILQLTNLVLTSKFGYYLFIFDERTKSGEVSLNDDEESFHVDLVLKTRNEDWFSFSLVLDKLTFLVYTVFYFYMFVAFIL